MDDSATIGARINQKWLAARLLQRKPVLTQTNDEALWIALGSSVRKQLKAEQILTRIVDVVTRILGADRGTLYLLDRDRGELVSVAAHLPELEELRVPLGRGLAGYVAREETIVNLPTRPVDAQVWPDVDASTGYETTSMLAAPLHDARGRLVGVLQILNQTSGVFDADQETKFAELARQTATILQETTLPDVTRTVGRDPAHETVQLTDRFNGVIAGSIAMRDVLRDVSKVADTDATVLLRGESGTGKGLIARALHHNSTRSAGPFVVADCTTMPDGLIENELFGHVRGAYTGADENAEGLIASANGGTLFLDEIGDLPVKMQAKLLTVLQDRTFTPVGSSQSETAEVRIIAASNRDLEKSVADGTFREDLYYRLRVVQIRMPSLSERGRADIIELVNHFVEKYAKRHNRPVHKVEQSAIEILVNYHWPGNVRELEHTIESAVIFCDGVLSADTLRELSKAPVSKDPFDDNPTIQVLEKRYILYLLNRLDGNKSACAKVMGVGRSTFHRKLLQYQID